MTGAILVYKNLFYYSVLMPIGGIETWLWSIGKKYGADHDIVVVYTRADEQQLRRLEQVVRCVQYTGQRFECEKAFFCYDANIIDRVDAKEYFLVVHGDYKAMGLRPPELPKVTRVIGVSQIVCDAYEELTGVKPELCFNPLIVSKPRKVLRLISATRMAPEKGIRRIDKFADILEKAGIPFVWDVYSDSTASFRSPYVIQRPRRLDVVDLMAAADYMVQLSDAEGEPYVVGEALSVGTPVIVTDFPSAFEMGVVPGVNGFVLPMDLSDVPTAAIYKGLKKFKYTPPTDRWSELLEPGEGTYLQEIADTELCQCISPYFDVVLNRSVNVGEYIRCAKDRAAYLAERQLTVTVPRS